MFEIKNTGPGTYRVDFTPETTLGQALAIMGSLDEQTRGRIDWHLDADAGNAFIGRERRAKA